MFVEDVESGAPRSAEILVASKVDLKGVNKRESWNFDWIQESKFEVYKLVLSEGGNIPPGLISIQEGIDGAYIEVMHLEASPENIGRNKKYSCVAGILLAYACQLSFLRGCEGWVAFESKTKLKKHYESVYGAKDTGMRCLFFDTNAAYELVKKYLITRS